MVTEDTTPLARVLSGWTLRARRPEATAVGRAGLRSNQEAQDVAESLTVGQTAGKASGRLRHVLAVLQGEQAACLGPWQSASRWSPVGSLQRRCSTASAGAVEADDALYRSRHRQTDLLGHVEVPIGPELRTRRFLVLSTGLVTSLQSPFSADSIMNTVGSDFRQGQVVHCCVFFR